MRTDTTMPIGWVPFVGAVLVVLILGGLLFLATLWIDLAVTPPAEVTTPQERAVELPPPPEPRIR